MNNLVHGLLRALRSLVGLHFKDEDLLAYRDREFGPFGCWCVETHLRRCAVCQWEAELIEEDLRTFEKMDHLSYASDPFSLPRGLGKLRKAIEDWEALDLLDDEVREPDRAIGEVALRQLTTEFDLYLGNHATAAFLLRVGNSEMKQAGLLVEAESVLRDFLGPSAASAVTRRVFQVQVLMTKGTQGDLTI